MNASVRARAAVLRWVPPALCLLALAVRGLHAAGLLGGSFGGSLGGMYAGAMLWAANCVVLCELTVRGAWGELARAVSRPGRGPRSG